ncbi:MAG: hypothetical protein H7039_02080 [Bryobacteraceae bacterium]|nr:hypothetical protein [Bryobacteraceae bacterium]
MGLVEIVVGLILFLFLAIVTLMMNPPERWVEKLTQQNKKSTSASPEAEEKKPRS